MQSKPGIFVEPKSKTLSSLKYSMGFISHGKPMYLPINPSEIQRLDINFKFEGVILDVAVRWVRQPFEGLIDVKANTDRVIASISKTSSTTSIAGRSLASRAVHNASFENTSFNSLILDI